MPLVYVGRAEEGPITDEHERARKIKPQYAHGELVRAGTARNQAEAELLQGILLEEGIPSLLRRTKGFDVPDFLAGGPRDVLVPSSALEPALELITGTPAAIAQEAISAQPGAGPARQLVYFMIAALIAFLIVLLLYLATT